MYLSQVEIDTQNRRKIRDLSHLGAYHYWVEQSFPDERGGERTRKLWRIDTLKGRRYLLVVRPTKPDLTRLEQYGVEGSGQTKDYESFLETLKEGTRARFRVTLNPVISVTEAGGARGRVKPHVTTAHQTQFLLDRSLKNGFSLGEQDFTITERGFVPLKKANEKPLELSRVTYEGVLTITDREQFIKTLTQGFGKKKAYGFGMMTVIPEGRDE